MRIYNTPKRKVEDFKPNSDVVRIYTCGPTVYSHPHIGNYASYIYWDLLIRALKAEGYKVKRVLNLTDVGHLVSDADEGEDKLEKGAAREGKTVWEVAEFYINDFFDGFHKLNLTEPDVVARATDYIEQIKAAVTKMTENGFTYETEDGIYFDTSKFAGYADFAHLDLENLKAGARVEFSDEKRNVSDFAVWKFIKPGEKHAMRWDYLGRPGYPGWHIECSTIIDTELGEPIDIHTGGIDHVPIHHTNEIAQTYAISGRTLANYWLHCDFIMIDGQKISKSLGNVYTLDDLIERGFDPMDFRLWILQGHFRGERNFTFDDLTAAKNRRLSWRNRVASTRWQGVDEGDSKYTTSNILASVSDNLNSAAACAVIDSQPMSLSDWEFLDNLFGLNLLGTTPDITDEQKAILADRAAARMSKDWATSDELRAKLEASGITVKDTAAGQIWQYLN